jgi:hypothetical protein
MKCSAEIQYYLNPDITYKIMHKPIKLEFYCNVLPKTLFGAAAIRYPYLGDAAISHPYFDFGYTTKIELVKLYHKKVKVTVEEII